MSICKICDRDYYEYNDVGDGLCPTCADIKESLPEIDVDKLEKAMIDYLQRPCATEK